MRLMRMLFWMVLMFLVLMWTPKWVMALIVAFTWSTSDLALTRIGVLEQREMIRGMFK